MSEKVLVIGSGGREHCICWKLAKSKQVKTVFVAPGNVGMTHVDKVKAVDLDVKNYQAVAKWCVSEGVALVAVGPEDPLAGGMADVLTEAGVACFGPGKKAAQIEADKEWAKRFMDENSIPTARWGSFTSAKAAKDFILKADFPALVVKASGLAAGKGVVVAESTAEACCAVDEMLTDKRLGSAGHTVVVEELLQGEEVSVLAVSDGQHVELLLPAQDHKRHLDGDQGANTGGMGAYCPCPLLTKQQLGTVREQVLQRAVSALAAAGTPFVGVLYAGLMLTPQGPRVLEFNCRFGDPETQVILPLLRSDLFELMKVCCAGQLKGTQLLWEPDLYAVGVVVASRGYPQSSSKGDPIEGLEAAASGGCLLFHSGTRQQGGRLETAGGRVLIAVALAPELALAAARATRACTRVTFPGAQFRRDIGHKGIARALLQRGRLTYKQAGVDISAGDSLVERIKPMVATTRRPGLMGGLGGFGGLFDGAAAGYKDPLLVSGTDGVGTKLKVAHECGVHRSVGIDLVAMCVNDILAHAAEPLFFLDYFACGALEVQTAAQVVEGVAEGCRQAGCALIGGETAEMPGLYDAGDYDLAGFAVGAVERSQLLPHTERIAPGDVVLGLPSSGLHSNGFSLARRVLQQSGVHLSDPAPFAPGHTIGEELLTPTRIYVRALLKALRSGRVKAMAHITGGGLTENIPRVLPPGTAVRLNARQWPVLPVFAWMAVMGGISTPELLRTFNCGIGAVLIVSPADKEAVLADIPDKSGLVIGSVEAWKGAGDGPRVCVDDFEAVMDSAMRPFVAPLVASLAPERKRVGVLISGSGTNLQALIDSTADPTQGMGAEIVLVISNKPGVEGLKRAERANIPTQVIRHTAYDSRLAFDMAVHTALTAARVDIVCLAGFMRIVTAEFVRLWRGRLINIHPSLLPSFKGPDAHRQVLASGVRLSGCTAHFVEVEIDSGAILAQQAVPVHVGDTEKSLQERVKCAEHKVFPRALRLVATGQVELKDDNTLEWKH